VTDEDPAVERLDEALADARQKVSQVIARGDVPEDSLRLLVEVRQDLVFMARESAKNRHAFHQRLEELDARKVDKNPNAVWLYRVILGGLVTSVFGLIVWLIQGGQG
jgi:hypothetical protein